MKKKYEPIDEGHSREWQDRARVVLDAKEKLKKDASPDQSPTPGENEDVEEKSPDIGTDVQRLNSKKDQQAGRKSPGSGQDKY